MVDPDISRLLSLLEIQLTLQNKVDFGDSVFRLSLSFPSIPSLHMDKYLMNWIFFSPHDCVKSGLNRHANQIALERYN